MAKHKHYDVIVAWANGKQLQSFDGDNWYDINWNPTFDEDIIYRVKPIKKHIPFTFEDVNFLIGKAIKSKIYTNVYIITEINENDILSGNRSWSYDYLLKEYVFLDGSPCGKLVE